MNKLSIYCNGSVYCKSKFYTAQDLLNTTPYTFSSGINLMAGEIDSGNWAISYLLAMYESHPEDCILSAPPEVNLNGGQSSLSELSSASCYMDPIFPLFSKEWTVKELMQQGLSESGVRCSLEEMKALFLLDDQRFERPLTGVGNEVFRSMAAIGCCYGKTIFCFPWMSRARFQYYQKNLTFALDKLGSLKKTVIFPVGA